MTVIPNYMMRWAMHHQINVNVKRIDGSRDVQNEGMRKLKRGGTTHPLWYVKKWSLIRDDCWMTRNSRRDSRMNWFHFMPPHVCTCAMIRLIYSARKKHETEHVILAFIGGDDYTRQCNLPGMLLKLEVLKQTMMF